MKSRKAFYIGISVTALLLMQSSLRAAISQPVTVQQSKTLPTDLSRKQFFEHIANQLDWVPEPQSHALCKGSYQEPDVVKNYTSPKPIEQEYTKVTATGPTQFRSDGVSILEDNVTVTQLGRLSTADKAYIYRNGKTGKVTKIKLVGNVHLQESGSLIVSDSATLNFDPRSTIFVSTAYHFHGEKDYTHTYEGSFNAWGTAQQGSQDPQKVTTLHHATYSTCRPNSPAWQLSASTIVLDKPNNIGTAYNTVIRFHSVPILYAPYYSFPLNNQRKSGILAPIIGSSSSAGFVFGQPIYWNMAPNYDMVITPEYYGDRNARLTSLFRYLTKISRGRLYFSFLPDDTKFEEFKSDTATTFSNTSLYSPGTYDPYLNELSRQNDFRSYVSFENYSAITDNLTVLVNLNYVSDPYYFADIRYDETGDSNTNQLLNLVFLQYTTPNWELDTYLQAYQTLHLITQISDSVQALDQYERLPTLSTVGYYNLSPHFDVELDGEFSDFVYDSIITPNNPNGQRLHIRPGISLPIENNIGYIKPQVWVDSTSYELQNTQPGQQSSTTRVLPIIDIDSGLYFNRNFQFHNHGYSQTFEPRLFYLYVPYDNQDDLPNFDSIQLPFYYQQLFSFNSYNGYDRQQNTNQVSIGATSRIISNETGRTILSGDLGGAYYFDNPKVCLTPGCDPTDNSFSPFITDLTYYPVPHWGVTGTFAWDTSHGTTNNASAKIIYAGDKRHLAYIQYSYTEGNNNSVAITASSSVTNSFTGTNSYIMAGFSWPLVRQWSIVGYANYYVDQQRMQDYYGGLSYETCCWALQLITQRSYASTTLNSDGSNSNSFDTRYYVQFTLKGLADFGTKPPSNWIEDSIPNI
jgi:LPS-assembly protein